MKVVILCGGEGIRLRDFTDVPKPLVEVGGKPILIHIMEYYSHFGFDEFVLCLGYRGDMIKQYFLEHKWRSTDFTLANGRLVFHKGKRNPWKISFVDTGKKTTKAERLLKIAKLVKQDENFFVAYGDDVADVNLKALLEFHKSNHKVATLTTTHPANPYGVIEFREDTPKEIRRFREKPKMVEWINGGFYVFRKDVFRYIEEGDELEKEVANKLVEKRQLVAYRHEGFWKSMNTFKDVQELNEMWEKNQVPWKRW